jgi:hypothetical protein
VVVYRCEARGRALGALEPETKTLEYFEREAID